MLPNEQSQVKDEVQSQQRHGYYRVAAPTVCHPPHNSTGLMNTILSSTTDASIFLIIQKQIFVNKLFNMCTAHVFLTHIDLISTYHLNNAMVNIYNNNSTIAVKRCIYTNFKYQTLPNTNQIINILAFSLLYNFTFYRHDFIYLYTLFMLLHMILELLENSSLTSYIPCLLNELNCSFMTPKNAHLIYFNTVLYRCYMFQRHLHHPQVALYQDLKLSKIQQFKK